MTERRSFLKAAIVGLISFVLPGIALASTKKLRPIWRCEGNRRVRVRMIQLRKGDRFIMKIQDFPAIDDTWIAEEDAHLREDGEPMVIARNATPLERSSETSHGMEPGRHLLGKRSPV